MPATAKVIQLPRRPRLDPKSKNGNYTKDRHGELVLTMPQRRQHELAWLLYITEGYIANVQHACTINSYTLDRNTLLVMQHAIEDARSTAGTIRNALQGKA